MKVKATKQPKEQCYIIKYNIYFSMYQKFNWAGSVFLIYWRQYSLGWYAMLKEPHATQVTGILKKIFIDGKSIYNEEGNAKNSFSVEDFAKTN